MLANNLCNGVVILDATEPRKTGALACIVENNYITLNFTSITQATLSLQPFHMYQSNLKPL